MNRFQLKWRTYACFARHMAMEMAMEMAIERLEYFKNSFDSGIGYSPRSILVCIILALIWNFSFEKRKPAWCRSIYRSDNFKFSGITLVCLCFFFQRNITQMTRLDFLYSSSIFQRSHFRWEPFPITIAIRQSRKWIHHIHRIFKGIRFICNNNRNNFRQIFWLRTQNNTRSFNEHHFIEKVSGCYDPLQNFSVRHLYIRCKWSDFISKTLDWLLRTISVDSCIIDFCFVVVVLLLDWKKVLSCTVKDWKGIL